MLLESHVRRQSVEVLMISVTTESKNDCITLQSNARHGGGGRDACSTRGCCGCSSDLQRLLRGCRKNEPRRSASHFTAGGSPRRFSEVRDSVGRRRRRRQRRTTIAWGGKYGK